MSPTITELDSSEQQGLHGLLAALASASRANDRNEDEDDTKSTTSTVASDPVSSNNDTEEEVETQEDKEVPEKEGKTHVSDFQKICNYLEAKDWHFCPKPDRGIIVSIGTGSNGTYQIVIDHKQDSCILIVYVYMPLKVPPNKRLDVAEFITRANHGIVVGNFEMDFEDGETRFKGSTCYDGGILTNGMIEDVLQRSAFTMNRYFPGLNQIIWGNFAPQQAIAEIEPTQSRGDTGTALAELLVQALGGEENDSEDTTGASTPLAPGTSTPLGDAPMAIATLSPS